MNLGLISKHRDSIFGISIIGIILFHYCESYEQAVTNGIITNNIVAFSYYKFIGSIGVEIFLFLSGMGLFYSYSQNHNLKGFYRKRYSRILICYIPMGIVFWALKDFVFSSKGLLAFLKDFTFLSFWLDGVSNVWFIALILILYTTFPIIYYIIYKNGTIRRTISFWGLISVVIAITIILRVFAPECYSNTEIALTRIPVFCLGCYSGLSIAQNRKIKKKSIIIIFTVGLVARCVTLIADFPNIFDRYAATLWAISLLLLICLCMNKLSGTFLERGLKTVGQYSLELYLSHVMARSIMNTIGFPIYRPVNFLIIVLVSIIISIGVHKMSEAINRRFLKIKCC